MRDFAKGALIVLIAVAVVYFAWSIFWATVRLFFFLVTVIAVAAVIALLWRVFVTGRR